MRKEKLVTPILMQFLYLYKNMSYFVEKHHFAGLLLWHHNCLQIWSNFFGKLSLEIKMYMQFGIFQQNTGKKHHFLPLGIWGARVTALPTHTYPSACFYDLTCALVDNSDENLETINISNLLWLHLFLPATRRRSVILIWKW